MKYKITDKNQPFLENGLLHERNWQFFKALEQLLDSQPEYFNTLAELNAAIPNPIDRQRAYIIGQGECRWKDPDWVLTADDTTVIV